MTEETPPLNPTLYMGPEIGLTEEMSQSFMDYAMSVIVARALPDVRDGLKPVQRRIIYSMNQANLVPNGRHRKCATVVGDVMARFHPHGDQAIYDALVRLGQDFSLGHPLVDPQGNFGSVEDPPGQMRYTECRLSEIAMSMLEGIDEDTVDFVENYDGEHREPVVLPSRYPNLLVNGAQGIAVGMATNIPPHNLGEVIDACIYLLDNPDCPPDDLLKYVRGPDFPSGGEIVADDAVKQALITGRGSVKVRAVAEPTEIRPGRTAIVVTELPYQVSQDRVLKKIADLVNQKEITGIADLRNESSSRVGTRLVIELKRGAVPEVIQNQLYKRTQLQSNFGVNMVALVDGVPRTMGIAEALGHYLDQQMEVVERRTRFRLEKASARAHILEGLCIAVDNITEVIAVIRSSANTPEARSRLADRFELSEIQANAILEMPLRRLTALESEKLAAELARLLEVIADLEDILAKPPRRWAIIRDTLKEVRQKHAVTRRSRLIGELGEMSIEDLIADEELIVTVSRSGYVKSVNAKSYRTQGRGGRGVKAAGLAEDDVVSHLVHTTAHSYLLFFTNRGVVHRLRAHEIPRQSRTGKGVLAHAVLPIEPEERIEAIIDTRDYETVKYLVMFTRQGMVKKTELKAYESQYKTLRAINLSPGDELVAVRTTNGDNDLLLFTEKGQGLRFHERGIRATGRATRGVIGMRLVKKNDRVVGACSDMEGDEVLLVTSKGFAKRTKVSRFPLHNRRGQGVIAIKLSQARGVLVGARTVGPETEVMLISSQGIAIRTAVSSVSVQSRTATGVRVQQVGEDGTLSAFEIVPTENGDG
ncbi:MAG: DNA gyrase subunit A [bacterium]|nr:DNA gyrase subunit A [bacterium]